MATARNTRIVTNGSTRPRSSNIAFQARMPSGSGGYGADAAAFAKIADLLKHQDDLDKVSDLKQKLLREKAAVDAQLKAGVHAQISVLSQGIQSLSEARQRVDMVKEDITKVNRIYEDTRLSPEEFERISYLSRVLKNFEDTQMFYDNFRTMQSDLESIRYLMAEDGDFSVNSPMPHLLTIHHELNRLRDVKDRAEILAQKSTEDVRRTIKRHFDPLDKLVEEFDDRLFVIAENLLGVIKAGNPSLVVRVAKIIDFEERQDVVCDISREISEENVTFKSTSDERRLIARGYPTLLFESIQRSIIAKFDRFIHKYSPSEDPEGLLTRLEWIVEDLALVKQYLSKCMPPRWKIFEKYTSYYHKEVYRLFNAVMDSDPSAKIILLVLDSARDYYTQFKRELGVRKAELSPALLDGKEGELYDEYLELIVKKTREWYSKIAADEKVPFISRVAEPDISDEGVIGMSGEQEVFRLLIQQLQVAAESGRARILAGCVIEFAKLLRERQNDWLKLMQEEVRKHIQDASRESGESTVAPGLFEYLIALANDQVRGADMTETIIFSTMDNLTDKYLEEAKAEVERTADGFITLARSVIKGMIAMIFSDIKPAYKALFVSSDWTKGRSSRQIVDTAYEYIRDCQKSMNRIIFEVFVEDLLSEAIFHYLQALGNAKKAIKVPAGIKRIDEDSAALFDLFSKQEFELDLPLEASFRVFEHITATLACPIVELPVQFQLMRDDFWDAPLDVFERIVRSRKDIDDKVIPQIMSSIRATFLQNQADKEETSGTQEPTFFSKFRDDDNSAF